MSTHTVRWMLFGWFLLISIMDLHAQSYRKEADNFLRCLPSGLSEKQRIAIQEACQGNTTALEAVRSQRNRPTPLNSAVEITEISPSLRLYRPTQRGKQPLPLLIYLHGGGWTIGSIHSCARFCSELAAQGQVMVLAVDYRLAPEYPYPMGLNDCIEAWRLARKEAEKWGSLPEWISIGGDSSGGNLTLATTLRLMQDHEDLPRSLILFYPVVSVWNDRSASWQAYQQGAGLDGSLMEAFNAAYCQGINHATQTDARQDLFISPSVTPDSLLCRLPHTLFIAAERDILYDQGQVFCNRLKKLNVDIERKVIPGSVHLFITVPGQERAFRRSVEWAGRFLQTPDLP